jgi:hypothetical protein
LRTFLEEGGIKLRREGLFLCLDGSARSSLWEGLYSFIKAQCRSFDVPLKIGILSWDKELNAPPEEDFLLSNTISKRGKFITPLMEEIFSKLEQKDYDLLIISAGRIYDWEDWQDDINVTFNRVYTYDLNRLEQMPQMELEEILLKEIFNFKISSISLYLESGVSYGFSSDFKLDIGKDKFILSKEFNSTFADIDLKTCGSTKETKCRLKAGGYEMELQLKNIAPEKIFIDSQLEDTDAKIFLNAVKSYKKKVFEHFCPLCQNVHRFSGPFLCDYQRIPSRLFAEEALIFNQIEAARRTESKYVVFQCKKDKVYYHLSDNAVICIDENKFIALSENKKINFIKISEKIEINEIEEIYKGLFYYPDEDIFVFIFLR